MIPLGQATATSSKRGAPVALSNAARPRLLGQQSLGATIPDRANALGTVRKEHLLAGQGGARLDEYRVHLSCTSRVGGYTTPSSGSASGG